ncbi:hypothetical protein [Paenibacillus hexagrammi]|uniref:Uncharacterized protein n=1 Tax=Paenibacillus hexagrammi TaxID=2908839 RepID=A0ABY3SUE9_9BACL|nr:hypothetical protein [Paenibacillus sp. YPD9-1]UJF36601.1 hypothetical protein L0M14_30395 [Paenibacillus sp. YPD9-1]
MMTVQDQVIDTKEINKIKQKAERALHAAETAIELKSKLEIQLDFQKKYNNCLEKTVQELKSRPIEKVEVPVVVELVPENIRKRMSELAKENRRLQEKVEQLEMVLSADGRELLLPVTDRLYATAE